MNNELVIIDYGAGNVQSVSYAFQRLGITPRLSRDVDEIRAAGKVIFPGVGHARAAMDALSEFGLGKLIPTLTQPVLGICLGMQLLARSSMEGDTESLGVIETDVKRFVSDGSYKIPHMGWNTLQTIDSENPLLKGITPADYFYFVHTYYMPLCGDTIGSADYIVPFTAVVNRNNFYGCQFHPEKSGQAGTKILENFLTL